MASGSFNLTRTGATSSYVNFLVNWSSYSNGSVANSSTLSIAVYVTKSSGSTSNTRGTVNTSVSVTDAGTQNENGISLNVAPNGSQLVFARNFTVPHNSDGKKSATISVNVGGDVVWGNGSQTVTLDRIPRQANITGASNFNDEQNPSFTFSKAGAGTLDVWLEPNPNGQHLAIRTNIPNSGSYTWNLTEEERDQLRNACKNSNSCICRIGLYTFIGDNTYVSYRDVRLNIINGNPIFENFDWQTTNYNILTGNNKTVIKNYSNIKTIINEENKASSLKQATLTNYQTTVGSKSVANNDLTYPVETIIEKVDGASITVFANDSRGNSTPVIKPITNYIDYKKIIGSISNLERTQQVNSEVNLQVEGEIDLVNFGAIVNSVVSAKYYYKEASSNDDFVEGTTKLNATLTQIEGTKYKYEIDQNIAGNLGANGFDINKSFLIKIVINDELDLVEDTETLGTGSPAIAIYNNCVSLGGPYNEQLGGRVQINGDIYSGNLDVYLNEEQIVGTWIDGRPVYRKVVAVNFGTSSSTKKNTPHNISNLHLVIKQDLIWYDTKDGGWFFDNKDKGLSDYYVCIDQVNTTDIVIKQNANDWQNRTRNRYAILEYIKTTD
ncbi:MAG: hypothetical protein IJZ77_04945 [Bacilli bacterium]|nr:hypothetical protein [Bacilli bacterium]